MKFLNFFEKRLYLENRARKGDFGKIVDPQGICEDLLFQVSINISVAKNGNHFEFSNFFFKNVKQKNACISKTVLDRAKFLTHRVALLSG